MEPRRLVLMGFLGTVGLLALAGAAEGQCVYACEFRNGCYYCIEGAAQDECHVACRVCWGYQCGPEPQAGEPAGIEPISSLTTIPTPVLEQHFETAAGEILSSVWSGFNGTPAHRADPLLNIKGKVAIDGSSHDFTLRIAQVRRVQVYVLDIADYGRLDLSLKAGTQTVSGDYSWVRSDGAESADRLSFDLAEPRTRFIVRHTIH